MKSHDENRELLIPFVLGQLSEKQVSEITQHLVECKACSGEVKQLGRLLECARQTEDLKADEQLSKSAKEAILAAAEEVDKTGPRPTINMQNVWRIIMKSRITKLATAAAIIIIAALSLMYVGELTSTAYALEQTIQANHSVRYLHIKDFRAGEDEPKQFWLEFDESGQVKNVRMDFPEWAGGGDGPKVVVWKDNKAQVWFKKKKSLVTVRDKTVADRMLKLAEEHDPRLAVERLYEREAQGKVRLEIDEPADKSEPIVVTARYLPQGSKPTVRWILSVDQATKLVSAIEVYQLKDGEYGYIGVMEFYDYNQPIEPEMFTLDEAPVDVLRVDQTTQEIGLLQGQLSDKEIAVEVVRRFFQALVDKDYSKAGKLLSGMPAGKMEEIFEKLNFIRIVSIGEPEPHSKTRSLRVPCEVEVERDGKTTLWKPHGPFVRQVHGQPDRWQIIGGI